MATVGNTSAPGSADQDYGTHAGTMAGSFFDMPSSGGLITTLHVYIATESGSSNAGYLCLWGSSGALLASVAVTIPGSMGWVSANLATPYFVPGGNGIFIGAQVNSSGTTGLHIYYESAGSPNVVDIGYNSTIPGNIANFKTESGNTQLGAYADYELGGWVWNGSSWVNGVAEVFDGSNWNPGALGVQVWNGSSWVTGS